jgi:hypothetical protein
MKTPNLDKAKEVIGQQIVDGLRKAAKADEFSNTGKLDKSFGYKKIKDGIDFFAEEYAGALSDGIDNKGKIGKQMISNLAEWAKQKNMRPMFRQYVKETIGGKVTYRPTGRFRKVTESSYKALGFLLARRIAKKGISERFGYKGSGFIDRVIKEQEQNVSDILSEAYKKDILNNLE